LHRVFGRSKNAGGHGWSKPLGYATSGTSEIWICDMEALEETAGIV
jgi:hypothetical protein